MAAPDALEALAEILGLSEDSENLTIALTHSSYLAEHDGVSNQRLEFLGDAVVDLCVTDIIIREHPELNEGTGSFTRAMVVNEASLADVARELHIDQCMRLGKGTRQEGVAHSDSIMADVFEAVVGALFLDRGYGAARDFVHHHLVGRINAASLNPDQHDPKSRLRDVLAGSGRGHAHFDVTEVGPPHDRRFRATIIVDGQVVAQATARSKKAAERDAALSALEVVGA